MLDAWRAIAGRSGQGLTPGFWGKAGRVQGSWVLLALALLTPACAPRQGRAPSAVQAPEGRTAQETTLPTGFSSPQGSTAEPSATVSPNGRSRPGHAHARVPEITELDPQLVRHFELVKKDTLIDLGHGVRYQAQTFGGTLPGPLLHVREGDEVTVRLINPAASSKGASAPGEGGSQGKAIGQAPLAQRAARLHALESLVLHGSQWVGPDLRRPVAPGEHHDVHFRATWPGVFAYHSSRPMVCEQVADGLFGALVVEPREGWPTRADHAYLVVQSELYAQARSAAGTLAFQGSASLPRRASSPGPASQSEDTRLDPVTVRYGPPSYLLHNGRIFGLGDPPLQALPGQRVRLYLLNAGPNRSAHFALEGLVFDRVYAGGNPRNLSVGLAVVEVPPGAGAVAEVVVPESGRILLTDHDLAAASEGAAGLLSSQEEGETEAAGPFLPAAWQPPARPASLRTGLAVFRQRCAVCHAPRAGARVGWEGPSLEQVTRRHDRAWMEAWLADPQALVARDARARRLRDRYGYTMPAQRSLTLAEFQALWAWLRWRDAQSPTL